MRTPPAACARAGTASNRAAAPASRTELRRRSRWPSPPLRSLFAAAKGTNMMMVVAVLEGFCSFLAAETWLRTGPRPTMMDTELHAAGGYVCLPHNRYRSHVVQSRGLQRSWVWRRRRGSGITLLKALHTDQANSGV